MRLPELTNAATTHLPIRWILPALVGTAMILAACSPHSTSGTSDTRPTTSASSFPSAVRTPGAYSKPSDAPLPTGPDKEAGENQTPTPQTWSAAPSQANPSANTNLLATDFRVGLHPDFYRVVVEFEGKGTPGWHAQWVDQAVSLGSGAPLPIKAGKHLDIVIEGTRMPILKGDPEQFYSGPADKWLDQDVVAWFDTAFESQTHIAVSAPTQRGYHIFTLTNPARLVVDIAK